MKACNIKTLNRSTADRFLPCIHLIYYSVSVKALLGCILSISKNVLSYMSVLTMSPIHVTEKLTFIQKLKNKPS